ncbi:SAF domain-containing protein [Streptomyces sp. NPDC093064]|uniref:SAF domain-containing protein n=1 Tax=Streptomyces sp. NPDC093064 TaxID=3366020 RepID=UPI0037F6FDBB
MKIQERTGAGAGRSAAPAQPSVGDRLPTAPRERKPALAALAVLLILVGALGATMLVLQAGDRIEVVKVTKDIQAGESVTSDDVTSVMVAADGSIDYVQWSQLGALKTLKAKSTIYAGTVVVGQMFGAKSSLPAGKASVGVALKEGQYPSGIKSGDIVAVYRVGDNSASSSSGSGGSSGSTGSSAGGNLIVDKARVSSRSDNSDAAVSTGSLSLTLLVDQSDAAAVAQAASAGSVAVVVVPGN